MQKSKLQYAIWGLCFLILIQIGWIGFRLNQLEQRKIEAVKAQEKRDREKEEKAKEELKSVPEPEIKEKLASGGRLWLEKVEASESGTLVLEIWAESEKEIDKIDLRIFYPDDFLRVIDSDWTIDKNGLALWSSSSRPATAGRILVKSISFKTLKSGNAAVEFDFNKESLLDCNLLTSEGGDILEEVRGGEYRINF